MALVIDTGVLLAALDATDPDHERCAILLRDTQEQRIMPDLVLGELEYWLRKKSGPSTFLALCQDLADGAYRLHALTSEQVVRAAEIEEKYADLNLGFVDAAVFVTCEVLGEDKVATLDRRHFAVLRTSQGEVLRLLP